MIVHSGQEDVLPERVVLIGAHGFVGAALQRRLEREAVATLGLNSRNVDLAAPAAADALCKLLRQTDAVVMLAALTPDRGRDASALLRNLAMMRAVSTALSTTGCAHFIYVSSDAVYGLRPSHVTEETPAAPDDLYGAMHLTREIMARGLGGTPVLTLRPTLVYGVDDTHNAYGPNRFRRAARKDGRIQLFGGGEETRDHIHVDDVAELTLRCLLRRTTGILNVATGRSMTFRAVASLVAAQFSRSIDVVETPRANPITHRHYDVTSLVKAFPGFRFTALEDGVARCHAEEGER